MKNVLLVHKCAPATSLIDRYVLAFKTVEKVIGKIIFRIATLIEVGVKIYINYEYECMTV